MELGFFDENDLEKNEAIELLKYRIKLLSAEKLYRFFEENRWEIGKYEELFKVDDHEIWYSLFDYNEEVDPLTIDSDDCTGVDKPDDEGEVSDDVTEDLSDEGEGNNFSSAKKFKQSAVEVEETWKHIASRMQMDLNIQTKEAGIGSGSLNVALENINKEQISYKKFLEKFATTGEILKSSDLEYDNIFYTYGLKIFGNIPLIEPLEYTEDRRIRNFVIAIDTSGSVKGETVQKFVKKTYNILLENDSFFDKINVHIIQCDSDIKEDVLITSRDEFLKYIKHMELKGFGGTDFRPVFDYVEGMIKNDTIGRLDGLIYFTDGFGTFPDKIPNFKTAFVFLEEPYGVKSVPPWAIKLVLSEDEIEDGE